MGTCWNLGVSVLGRPLSVVKVSWRKAKFKAALYYFQMLIILSDTHIYIYTSSTAQGGGGSLKTRKPIGEIGCCESGMAERIHWWTERCLRSPLFLSLFLWLSTYLPAYLLCIYVSIYLSNLSISLSLFDLSICLAVYLSSCLPVYLSFYLSICLPVYLSICGAVSFSVM